MSDIQVQVNKDSLKKVRNVFRQESPIYRSSSVAEALAASLGFGSSIALNTTLEKRGDLLTNYNSTGFAQRLQDLSAFPEQARTFALFSSKLWRSMLNGREIRTRKLMTQLHRLGSITWDRASHTTTMANIRAINDAMAFVQLGTYLGIMDALPLSNGDVGLTLAGSDQTVFRFTGDGHVISSLEGEPRTLPLSAFSSDAVLMSGGAITCLIAARNMSRAITEHIGSTPWEDCILSVVSGDDQSFLIAFSGNEMRYATSSLPPEFEEVMSMGGDDFWDNASTERQAELLDIGARHLAERPWSSDGVPLKRALADGDSLHEVRFGGLRDFGMGYLGVDVGVIRMPTSIITPAA